MEIFCRRPKTGQFWDGYLYSKSGIYNEEFLYDLENDIYEKHNLVGDPAYENVRKGLAEILKRKMKEAGEEIPKIFPTRV